MAEGDSHIAKLLAFQVFILELTFLSCLSITCCFGWGLWTLKRVSNLPGFDHVFMIIVFPIVHFGVVQWNFGDRSITKYSLVNFNIYIAHWRHHLN